jgi:hypothetical protein
MKRFIVLASVFAVGSASACSGPSDSTSGDTTPDGSGPPEDGIVLPMPEGSSDDGGLTGDGMPPGEAASESGVDAGPAVRGQACAGYVKASPANGGREYFVAASGGSDGNDGSSGAPFQTVQHAASVAKAGDVVTIRAGSYTELVKVQNSGAQGAPIVFQADQCGQAVFTGNTSFYPQIEGSPTVNNGCTSNAPGQHDITLSGLSFKDTHDSTPASQGNPPNYSTVVLMVDNWRLTNVSIDGADDIEVNVRGTGDVIEQSTFLHGGSHSLVGCGGNTVVRNVMNGNNVTNPNAAANCGDSCSVKFLFTNGMMVDNIESFGNNGPGWWFDTDNHNFTVQNSYFHDNQGAGIADEISDGPGVIQKNTFLNNGADVGIWESKAVTITNNIMNGGSGSPFQIRTMTNRCEVQNGSSCTTWYQVGNLVIHDNKAKNWTGCLIEDPAYSSDPQWADPPFQKLNIQMDFDDLSPAPSSSCFLSWQNEPSVTSVASMQSVLGVEAHGNQASF